MIRTCKDRNAACDRHGVGDLLLGTGHNDGPHIGLTGAIPNLNDHGHTANIGERFARQAGGGHAGRNHH